MKKVALLVDACRWCGREIRNTRVPDHGWQHTWNLQSPCYPPEQFAGAHAEPLSAVAS